MERWTEEWNGVKNGFACDRAIFFLDNAAFCASAWDGEFYTWMEIATGKEMQVADAGWGNGDIRVLLSYT